MTHTTTHPAGATLDYSIDFTDALPEGVALASFEATATGVTLVSAARDGSTVSAIVSGGVNGTRAQILLTGITDETPPRRHPQAICLLVAVVCATELAA